MDNFLTSSDFWESTAPEKIGKEKITSNKIIFFLRDCVYFSSLQYELFLKLLPKFLLKNDNVLEVGSGPGRNLTIISKIIGCDVFGIEKSKTRYEQNKKIFKNNGIPEINVIEADFLKVKSRSTFDCVLTNGLIEHHSKPSKLVFEQSKFLKKNGILVCCIPNFTGINFFIQNKLDKKILSAHNIEIMKIDNFKKLFKDYETLYCGYLGLFSARIFYSPFKTIRYFSLILKPLRVILNILFILFASFFSTSKISTGPYLVFVGRKTKQ